MDGRSLAKVRNLVPFAQDAIQNHSSEGAQITADATDSTILSRPSESLNSHLPSTSRLKSNIDLVKECDSFPYHETDPKSYNAHVSTYYTLHVAAYPETPLGYVLPSVAQVFDNLPNWSLDSTNRTLTLTGGNTQPERSAIVASTTAAMRTTKHFAVLDGWRDELYPVYGPDRELLFSVERAASALFGIVSYGCHMTAYTFREPASQSEHETEVESSSTSKKQPRSGMYIWVPRRAHSKQTYGGMLDNTVAGGLATGESVFEGLVRESAEEASLPEDLVRERAKAVGAVSYFHIRDDRAGGESRLLQPEIQYVYDIELPPEVVPKPSDDEVQEFNLWTVDQVQQAMAKGEFKPNCALVLLDFFIRHGLLTRDNEEHYTEIVSRLHRRMAFPTC